MHRISTCGAACDENLPFFVIVARQGKGERSKDKSESTGRSSGFAGHVSRNHVNLTFRDSDTDRRDDKRTDVQHPCPACSKQPEGKQVSQMPLSKQPFFCGGRPLEVGSSERWVASRERWLVPTSSYYLGRRIAHASLKKRSHYSFGS